MNAGSRRLGLRPRRVFPLILVAVLAGCSFVQKATPAPLSARGEVALAGGSFRPGQPCAGAGRTASVRPGAAVYVEGTDAQGPIATGTMGPGLAVSASVCVLPFDVAGIPPGFEQYRVVVFDPREGILGMVEHLSASRLVVPILIEIPAGQPGPSPAASG